MNWNSILTFIIFRSHLMEVERNQFSLLLREAYSCLSLWLKYVYSCVGYSLSLSAFYLSPGLFISLYLSLMYDSLLFPFVLIFHPYSSHCDYPRAYRRILMKIHNIFPSQLIPYQRRNLVPENQFSFILLSPSLLHLHARFLRFSAVKQQGGT